MNKILLRWHQWYFSNGNDYENGNTLKVVNGYENENYIDFQNENNIKIKTMSYKTYKNENVLKENEK